MQLSFHKRSGTGETPMLCELFARRQAISGAERSRAALYHRRDHACIPDLTPTGDDQKLESLVGLLFVGRLFGHLIPSDPIT